jgi:hypothetical protein
VDARTDSRRALPGDSEAGVVAASVYAGGRRVKDIAIEEAGEWSKRPGHVVWIGLWEPSADLLQRVQAQLGLHYLAIEDAGAEAPCASVRTPPMSERRTRTPRSSPHRYQATACSPRLNLTGIFK